MIEVFKGWINSMLCLGIFVTLVQLIMPKANIKKYIFSLIGVVTIITIIAPIIDLMKNNDVKDSVSQVLSNISNETNTTKVDVEKYKNAKEEAVKEGFIEGVKGDIKSKLLMKGIKVKNIDISLDTSYDIVKVEVNIKKLDDTKSNIDTVNEVVNYINTEYDIDFTKIVVIEEGE